MGEETRHQPVLQRKGLEGLAARPGGRYVDGTVGAGGHAAAMLAASSPTGWMYGCDCDGAAVAAAQRRLAEFAGRFELRQGNFAELPEWIAAGSCDGVLLDLGLSSDQLDDPDRGFSFLRDGPLDMRKDRRQAQTAADLVNGADVEELARIFWEWGGERDSRRLARVLAQERQRGRIESTGQLAALIVAAKPRAGRKSHPATQVFQALRVAVNDELGSLERGLAGAFSLLRPGGRLAVITFHSAEDRLVKAFGRERARDYTFPGETDIPELRQPRSAEARWVTRKAVRPDAIEIAQNPRSRSAQLRVLEKMV